MKLSAATRHLSAAPMVLLALGSLFLPQLVATVTVSPSTEAQSVQTQIDAALAQHPGGMQTSVNEVSWEGGAIVLTIELPGIVNRAVGTCADGAFCAFSGGSLTGNKLSFSSCGTYSVSSLGGVVRSVANGRSSGSVQGKNASNSVLTTVPAGSRNDSAPSGITKLSCV